MNIFYNLIVRYGLLWIIPVAIMYMAEERRKFIIKYTICCSLFVIAVQVYALYSQDPLFIISAYSQFDNIETNIYDPETSLHGYFQADLLPRLYPSGAILVQMVMVYLIGLYFIKNRIKNLSKFLLLLVIICCFMFILSLQQRSAFLALFIAVLFIITRPNINFGTRLPRILIAGIIMLLCLYFFGKAMEFPLIETMEDRFSQGLIDTPNRMLDNGLALVEIIHSPLYGNGRAYLLEEALNAGLDTHGYDAHALLQASAMAGLPFMIMIFIIIIKLFRRSILMKSQYHDPEVISISAALIYVVFLSLINTVQLFTEIKDIVPFVIFMGLLLAKFNQISHINAEESN
jgi:hypothetical protein